MSFVFFTSYARVNKTRYLEKFVKELSQQVLDKTSFPPEQISFFDGSNIGTGQDWARVLGDALRTCKVIVYQRIRSWTIRSATLREHPVLT